MIELQFGVPSQRRTVEEKHADKAVITLEAWKGKGTSKKFSLNKNATELLMLEEEATISFSFNVVDRVVMILNSTGLDIDSIKVTKTKPRSMSNSKTYDFFTKFLNLNNEIDNEFELEVVDEVLFEGRPLFSIRNLNEVVENVEVKEEDQIEMDSESILEEQVQEVN